MNDKNDKFAIIKKPKTMKTIFLALAVFISLNGFSQQQIPNGNFEDWTNGEADYWNSLPIYTAEQTSDVLQGNSAVKLVSQSALGQLIPGVITLGTIDSGNQTLTGGIPYTDRPDGIRFFFKYLPSGIDTMFFGVFLTKLNDVTLNIDTIATTGYLNSNTFNTYTKVELPFIYQSTELPDTLNIIFSSSGFGGNAGSTLFTDSLSVFFGTAVSPTFCFPAEDISNSSFTANWMAVPNATSYSLDVSETSDFSSFLSAYENLNTGLDTFYVVNVSPGIYYYRVRVNYDTETSINSNTVEVTTESNAIEQFNSNDIVVSANRNIITVKSTDFYFDEIKLYNIEGKLINEVNKPEKEARFFVKTPGVYISVIKSGNIAIRKKTVIIF